MRKIFIIKTPTEEVVLNLDAIKLVCIQKNKIIISLGLDYSIDFDYDEKVYNNLINAMKGEY